MKQSFKVFAIPQDGVYEAHFPYHPGCSASGDTVEEAVRRSKDAMVTYLETLIDEGFDIDLDVVDPPHVAVAEVEIELTPKIAAKAGDEAEYLQSEVTQVDQAKKRERAPARA
jgi:predicted RNase H-like HicB family nuclease